MTQHRKPAPPKWRSTTNPEEFLNDVSGPAKPRRKNGRFPLEVRYNWDKLPLEQRPARVRMNVENLLYSDQWALYRNYSSEKARDDAIRELEKKARTSPYRLERVAEYRIPEDSE